ncbi:MAG: ATP-binding protein, partial [Synergistaceae bacterium]|nr:ATP-binding protein [Synergistaceae bacterium]
MAMIIKERERGAIIQSLASGVVPKIGLQHIQVDRKDEILAMIDDLDRIGKGGTSVRFVIGPFGTGKSFFLNLTKAVAVTEKFVVMQADMALKRRLASSTGYARGLYAELVSGMSVKSNPDGGALESVMEKWIRSLPDKKPGGPFDIEASTRAELRPMQDMPGGFHFIDVVIKYCESYLYGNSRVLRAAQRWLAGGFDKHSEARALLGVDALIGDKDVYNYLKLWGAFFRIAGYPGLLVLLDEMGIIAHGLSNTAARSGNYEVILQILNDCLQGAASGIGFLFAGADFFIDDEKTGMMGHGALASRLAPNPFAAGGLKDFSGPIIRLGQFSPEDLYLLLEKIRDVFAMGDPAKYLIPDEAIHPFMNRAALSLGPEFYKTPREAVKLFTGFLSVLEQNPQVSWRALLNTAVMDGAESRAVAARDGEPRRIALHTPPAPQTAPAADRAAEPARRNAPIQSAAPDVTPSAASKPVAAPDSAPKAS